MAVDLAAADPLPVALRHLREDVALLALLSDDEDPTRVGPTNAAPYPRIRIRYTPGGSDRDARWLLAPEVQVEVFGDLDGSTDTPAMRQIMYRAIGRLMTLPERDPDPAEAVITSVESSGTAGPVPEPSGQPRWAATFLLYNHPPLPG